MYTVQVKAHDVEIARITNVTMLQIRGEILSPQQGVTLVLDDDSRHTWMVEAGIKPPCVGEFLIVDKNLGGISYIVDSAKLTLLFGAYVEAKE